MSTNDNNGADQAFPLPEKEINVIFDGPPSHESGRFVEVEDDKGCSIRVGEWVDREDGLWSLRILLPLASHFSAPQEGTGAELPDHCYACEKPCVYSDIPDPTNGAARCVDCLVKIQATHIKNLEGAASPSPTEGEARKVLEFYAEEKNWQAIFDLDGESTGFAVMDSDEGARARAFLSQYKGGGSDV